MGKLYNVGALWKGKEGKLPSGSFDLKKLKAALSEVTGEKARVVILPNRYKDNDKKPDYDICVTQDDRQQPARLSENLGDDDIPF